MENVRINQFEIENVKRVKTVAYDCEGEALTVIGGNNAQGKTSVLDAIMWTLGGDRLKPSNALHEGAEKLATKIELSNGITVERRGQGSLKITSPDGRSGQALLNEFVSVFALNLPKFMGATQTEKAKILLDIFPELGPKLQKMNEQVKAMYDERHAMGQISTRKAKHAEDLPFNEDVPEAPLSGKAMTDKLQDALAVNARNAETRRRGSLITKQIEQKATEIEEQNKRIAELENRLLQERERLEEITNSRKAMMAEQREASEAIVHLIDENTTALESQLEEIDAINAKVRQNLDKKQAEDEAARLQEEYRDLTQKIEEARQERIKLLAQVDMPLEGLEISEEGALLYQGQPWDGMSGSEQMRVAVAICSGVNPLCGFVLLDGMERMDIKQLREFSAWLGARGLQAIGTRVGTGDECSLIIEDGSVRALLEAKPASQIEDMNF